LRKVLVLASLIFALLIGLIALTQTFVLLVALAVTFSMTIYFLVALGRQKYKSDMPFSEYMKIKNVQLPFIVFFGLAIIPIGFASYYAAGEFTPISVYSIVVAFGMTLTFMLGFVNLPLSLYHKKMERMAKSPFLTPLVSIVVPAYNERLTIEKTIASIAEADYPYKELIVVDDGSTDDTFAVASAAIKKITTIPQGLLAVIRKPNGGKTSALNYALRFAKGDHVIFVDSDSIIGRDSIKEIMKYFQYPDVVAVGGNIKVVNRVNFLTRCQALEYVKSINFFKRAFDLFGSVMIVPGALGGFQKKVLIERGHYDKDTLAEDFDATLKVLKSGKGVQASSFAVSFTDAPLTLLQFYKQRLRWNRGNMQTLLKHRDVITSSRYGMLHKYGYPLMFLLMVIQPFLGLAVTAFSILAIIEGQWLFILVTFLVFLCLEFLLCATAIAMENESWTLLLYAVFFVIGYKQVLDFIIVKSIFDVLFRKDLKWT
jgi:cellulose synthase/poly-beta-1,6-N-acetylglucosamine synthase-like glycosyltransferase